MTDNHSPTLKPAAQVINAESFTEAQKRCVERYLDLSSVAGTLVGAHVGSGKSYDAQWDLRPLVLDKGVVHVVRFSDPQLALDNARFQWLERVIQKHQSLSISDVLSSGSKSGQLWTVRPYYGHVLSDLVELPKIASAQILLLEKIVTQLEILHRSGIVHGHLTLGNIVIKAGTPRILDPGFHATSPLQIPQNASDAPALFPPEAATDIDALAAIAQTLCREAMTLGVAAIVTQIQNSDAALRPTLEHVASELRKITAPKEQTSAPGENNAPVTQGTKSGKFISKHAPPVASSAPSRELKKTEIVSPELLAKARKELLASVPPPVAPKPLAGPAPAKVAVMVPDASAAKMPESNTENLKVDAKKESKTAQEKKRFVVLAAFATLIAAASIVHAFHLDSSLFGTSHNLPFNDYWKSGEQGLMAQVAEAAIDGNPEAAHAIITDALSGANRAPLAHSGMLRFIFQPRWNNSLSAQDRRTTLRLALAPLYPEGSQGLSFDALNPLVTVGVISDLPLDTPLGPFAQLPLANLQKLPAPLSEVFGRLLSAGVTSVGAPETRAFAHLMVGDPSDPVLGTIANAANSRTLVAALQPLLTEAPPIADAIATYLERDGSGEIVDDFRWFDSEEVANWGDVGNNEKLLIATGEPLPSNLTLEQFADLLKYPESNVRQAAAAMLVKSMVPADAVTTVQTLANDRNKLTRFQTVALVESFKLDADSFYPFLKRWFQAAPDPGTVLAILLVRGSSTSVDPFDVEAARYLSKATWDASIGELVKLTKHKEPLARVLAYTKLNPAAPNERAILESAQKVEKDAHLQEQIQQALAAQ